MITIPYHPSYGYATEEQIKQLIELKDGCEYKPLLKKIELQTKKRGKME